MDDGMDMGGGGGDIGGDLSGSDVSVDTGGDLGGDLASDDGVDLSGNTDGDIGDDIAGADLGEGNLSDADLNSEEGDDLNGTEDAVLDSEEGDDLNGTEDGEFSSEEGDDLGSAEDGELDSEEGDNLNDTDDNALNSEEGEDLHGSEGDGNEDGGDLNGLNDNLGGEEVDDLGIEMDEERSDKSPDSEEEELDKMVEESDNSSDSQGTEGETDTEENPFNDDGSLKPNIEYSTGEYGYQYETDENGRISSFKTDNLQLTEREDRLPHNSQTFDKGEFDDAGHLFGDRFGGSPELDNLVSQDSHINRSEYKAMENEWADAIRNGSHVEVSGEVGYDSDSHRPSSFDVFYSIDDEVYEKSFTNRREQ